MMPDHRVAPGYRIAQGYASHRTLVRDCDKWAIPRRVGMYWGSIGLRVSA